MTEHLNCVTFQPERPVVGDEEQETALIGRAANGLKRAPISPPFLLAATAEPIWAETLDADDGRYLSAACLPVSWMSKVVCNQEPSPAFVYADVQQWLVVAVHYVEPRLVSRHPLYDHQPVPLS